MGANIELQKTGGSIEPTANIIARTSDLKGITLNANLVANMIDEMPAFFIAASVAEGATKVKEAKELRTKESDRLQAMSEVLDSFGVKFRLEDEGITINLVTHHIIKKKNVSNKVIFLHEGAIETQGPPAEMFDNPASPRFRQFLANALH